MDKSQTNISEILLKALKPSKTRKEDLIKIYQNLGGQTEDECKRQLLKGIVSGLFTQLHKLFRKHRNELKQKKSIALPLLIQEFEAKINELQIPKGSTSFPKRACQAYYLENMEFESEDKESCIMTGSKQIKGSKEEITNIWNRSNNTWIECLCPKPPSNLSENKNLEQCYRCGKICHALCFWPKQNNEFFECPFCYLIYCMPQKAVKEVCFAGYFPFIKKQKNQYQVKFQISPEDKRTDQGYYLQARCAKFNSKNRYQISWPDSGSLSVNRTKITDFKPLTSNSPLKRRTDEAVRLNNIKDGHYEIIVQDKNCSQKSYKVNKRCYHLFMVFLVRDLSVSELTGVLRENSLSVSESKRILKQYLNHQGQGLTIEKLAISLKCQYFMERMTLPARSIVCNTHFQPFDLISMIVSSINAKSSSKKWKCPICDKRAYHVFVDQYICSIISEHPHAMEIILKKDAELQVGEECEEVPQNQVENEKEESSKKKQSESNLQQRMVQIIDSESEGEQPLKGNFLEEQRIINENEIELSSNRSSSYQPSRSSSEHDNNYYSDQSELQADLVSPKKPLISVINEQVIDLLQSSCQNQLNPSQPNLCHQQNQSFSQSKSQQNQKQAINSSPLPLKQRRYEVQAPLPKKIRAAQKILEIEESEEQKHQNNDKLLESLEGKKGAALKSKMQEAHHIINFDYKDQDILEVECTQFESIYNKLLQGIGSLAI